MIELRITNDDVSVEMDRKPSVDLLHQLMFGITCMLDMYSRTAEIDVSEVYEFISRFLDAGVASMERDEGE